MTQSEVNEIIKRHQHYILKDCENWQTMCADFSEQDLRNITFMGADLRFANFRYANLRRANFSGATLDGANFQIANLQQADFSEASLIDVYFDGAVLVGAYFWSANLKGASFNYANCTFVDFLNANLDKVYFSNTTLCHAILVYAENIPYIPMICPEEGTFIGWKKVNDFLIKLKIPAEAKRSSATTRKCRCEYAKVLGIYNFNGDIADVLEVTNTFYSPNVTYKIGEMVYPDDFDENRWNECSHGIHFFMNKQEAIDYELPLPLYKED